MHQILWLDFRGPASKEREGKQRGGREEKRCREGKEGKKGGKGAYKNFPSYATVCHIKIVHANMIGPTRGRLCLCSEL